MKEWLELIPPWLWITFAVHGAVLGTVAYLILLERKIASWVQDRIGPNRVGPLGLLQPIADGLKFILKEDYRPKGVDKVLFTIAPAVMIITIIVSIAVIPWGGEKVSSKTIMLPSGVTTVTAQQIHDTIPWYGRPVGTPVISGNSATISYGWWFQIAHLDNMGVLFILATLSLAVYGVVVGGWASNNKYSFLGGLRATANMISYEIPMGLAVLTLVVLFGTLDLGDIVTKQTHYWLGVIPAWNVFSQPLTFILFLICLHAEANRAPFDLAEAEQELVGGYHTEYSAMRFALFFLAEYAGMITTSALCVCLFFGGWHLPWIEWAWPALAGDPSNREQTTSIVACVVRSIVLFSKTGAILFVFMWVRWSLPRFRFDQLMMLAWRALIPMSLALLIVSSVILYYFGPEDAYYVATKMLDGKFALILCLSNVAILALFMIFSRLVPAAPETNRKLPVLGSRYNRSLVTSN